MLLCLIPCFKVTGCGSVFHAVNQANKKLLKGYATSGVVACVCARHSLVQKNSVGDLQLGERCASSFPSCKFIADQRSHSYTNTDYILASVLKTVTVERVAISYDIACKWSIHLPKRFAVNHPGVNIKKLELSYFIPKFHLPGHGASCQTKYSFNYAKGVGRTHGETVEQEWAHINLAATSTREMGPGARHLALDDHWGGWNWKKILGMGNLLRQSLVKALKMKGKHAAVNEKFDATISDELREEWRTMVRDWEKDNSKPNPFTHTEKGKNPTRFTPHDAHIVQPAS